MNPLPDYWLAVLHKRLMGQIVLNATSEVGLAWPARVRALRPGPRRRPLIPQPRRDESDQPHPASCPRAAALASRIQSGASGARVPAGSLGFFVWPDAQLPACAKQRELESVCKAARA